MTITATTVNGLTASATVKAARFVPVTSFAISVDKQTLAARSKQTVKTTTSPDTSATINCETSDKNVVTVDDSGVVTAQALGKATITATLTDSFGNVKKASLDYTLTLADTAAMFSDTDIYQVLETLSSKRITDLLAAGDLTY